MRDTGPVWAFDLGMDRTGFAAGAPGERPRSGTVLLRRRGEPRAIAFGNFIAFLQAEWSREPPRLVAVLKPMHLGGFSNVAEGKGGRGGTSEAAVRASYGQNGILEGMCVRFGAPLEELHEMTVTKHFLGTGRIKAERGRSARDTKKHLMIVRCHQLKIFGRDKYDPDRAEACAAHDYACAMFCRTSVSMTSLHFFGEQPR